MAADDPLLVMWNRSAMPRIVAAAAVPVLPASALLAANGRSAAALALSVLALVLLTATVLLTGTAPAREPVARRHPALITPGPWPEPVPRSAPDTAPTGLPDTAPTGLDLERLALLSGAVLEVGRALTDSAGAASALHGTLAQNARTAAESIDAIVRDIKDMTDATLGITESASDLVELACSSIDTVSQQVDDLRSRADGVTAALEQAVAVVHPLQEAPGTGPGPSPHVRTSEA